MRVIIEAEIADWWGVDDLIADMPDADAGDQDAAIVELLREDLLALLDGAAWRIVRDAK